MLKTLTRAGVAGVIALSLQAMPASAHDYHHRHYHHARRHHARHVARCRTGGTVLGVLGGALAGNALTHHSTAGTIVGAGVGGVAGHQIARRNCGR